MHGKTRKDCMKVNGKFHSNDTARFQHMRCRQQERHTQENGTA